VKYLTDDKKMLLNMVEKLTNEVSSLKLEEQKMSVKYSTLIKENEMLKCVEVENEQFMDCNLEMP
jgi:hypothetical protein